MTHTQRQTTIIERYQKQAREQASQLRESRRTMSESKFWKKIALQQQALLHAKNKT
ncbi:MAG: hypothetical protein Q8R36_02835 [bacterium]|nr:hypothetical protein [bacterium]